MRPPYEKCDNSTTKSSSASRFRKSFFASATVVPSARPSPCDRGSCVFSIGQPPRAADATRRRSCGLRCERKEGSLGLDNRKGDKGLTPFRLSLTPLPSAAARLWPPKVMGLVRWMCYEDRLAHRLWGACGFPAKRPTATGKTKGGSAEFFEWRYEDGDQRRIGCTPWQRGRQRRNRCRVVLPSSYGLYRASLRVGTAGNVPSPIEINRLGTDQRARPRPKQCGGALHRSQLTR